MKLYDRQIQFMTIKRIDFRYEKALNKTRLSGRLLLCIESHTRVVEVKTLGRHNDLPLAAK